jgi:hypothetical protein
MFLPQPAQHDGTLAGNSYISLWLRCRRKWLARYKWPHADGSTGLEPEYGQLRLGKRGLVGPGNNLMLGSLLHAYKEAWYLSGIKDGEDTGAYDHEFALEALDSYLAVRANEFADEEARDWARTNVAGWCEAFHRFYGPEGHTPLYPETRVLCFEDGKPAVETEFKVPLGYRDLVYTCRMDGVGLYQGQYLMGLEHKTAAPSWADRYVNQLPKGSQFTGEMFVMRNALQLKDYPFDKIQVAFHLKGWSKRSVFPAPVMFGDVHRTDEQLARFRLRVITVLDEIEEAVAAWDRGLESGHDLVYLADRLFPETGENTSECYAFNSECEFMGTCRMGFGPGTLGGYRPGRRPPAEGVDTDDGLR